jgi:hypothetical protein
VVSYEGFVEASSTIKGRETDRSCQKDWRASTVLADERMRARTTS